MPNEAEIEKKEKGFVAHFVFWVAVVFCLLAIYVLSIGPVGKFAYRGGRTSAPLMETAYAPIGWVCEHDAFSERFMSWYLGNVWGIENFQ